jgi:hypothetical protein
MAVRTDVAVTPLLCFETFLALGGGVDWRLPVSLAIFWGPYPCAVSFPNGCHDRESVSPTISSSLCKGKSHRRALNSQRNCIGRPIIRLDLLQVANMAALTPAAKRRLWCKFKATRN